MKNIGKLEVEKEYTYKELCALFEEKEKTSHSKDAQKKEWARHFRWSNPKRTKYRIEEIYETPLPREDGRKRNGGNNTSKYLSLDDVIMDYLNEQNYVLCTLPQLAVKLGILSEQYDIHRKNIKEFSQKNNYSFDLVSAFFEKIRSVVLTDIKSSLDRLKKGKFIDCHSFIVLVLVDGKSVALSDEETAKVVGLENNVLKGMGASREEVYKSEEKFRKYNTQVKKRILEETGYDIRLYYKTYEIKNLLSNYHKKGDETIWRLTRKFIITICGGMLKFACVDAGKNIDSNLPQEDDSSDILHKIIELANYFFVHMEWNLWDEFWKDDALNWRNEERAMLFWSQYCLVKMAADIEKKRLNEQQKQQRHEKSKREVAIAELGEEAVLEFEYILVELDWERCFVDEDYTENCGKALEAYYDKKKLLYYAKDEHVEEFCLYFSRMTRKGKESEIIPFYEFVKQFKETDVSRCF